MSVFFHQSMISYCLQVSAMRVLFFSNILLFVLCMVVSAQSDNVVRDDHSHVELRMPSDRALGDFRNNPDFNYSRNFEYGKTLWETIKYYFAKFIRRLYAIDETGNWLRWLWIALLAGVLVFGISKMTGVGFSGIFVGKPPPVVDLSDTVVDEHAGRDKLGAMLEKSLEEKQYRLAVRIAYLISLQRLSELGQIRWQADKTNRSYLGEISDDALRQHFANLARLYEYVWYGDFDIHAEHYREIEPDFNRLR